MLKISLGRPAMVSPYEESWRLTRLSPQMIEQEHLIRQDDYLRCFGLYKQSRSAVSWVGTFVIITILAPLVMLSTKSIMATVATVLAIVMAKLAYTARLKRKSDILKERFETYPRPVLKKRQDEQNDEKFDFGLQVPPSEPKPFFDFKFDDEHEEQKRNSIYKDNIATLSFDPYDPYESCEPSLEELIKQLRQAAPTVSS